MRGAFTRFVFVMAIAIGVPHQLIAQSPKHTMEEIVAAWTKRQADFKTATISWKERRTIKKGAYPTPPSDKTSQHPPEPHPPEDATFEFPNTLTVSGNKMRFGHEPQMWSLQARKWIVDPSIYAFNGGETRSFHDKGLDRFPTGVIRANDFYSDFNNYHLFPILMVIRPVQQDLTPIDVNRIKNTGNSAIIGNSLCMELTMPEPTSRSQTLIWVDPSKQFTIARYEYRAEEKLKLRISVTYVRDNDHGWLPQTWDGIAMNPEDKMRLSFHSEVQRFQINQVIADDEFDFVFPEGTLVVDLTKPRSTSYIVKSDGQKRVIKRNELQKPYEELDKTSFMPDTRFHMVLVAVSLAVVIATVAYWCNRKRKRCSQIPCGNVSNPSLDQGTT